jgi:hypothetical protein
LGRESAPQATFTAGQIITPAAVERELNRKRLRVVGVKSAPV